MGYSGQVYRQAKQTLADRRQTAFEIGMAHRREIYSKLPEISVIDSKLAKTGVAVIKAVSEGRNDIAQLVESLKEESLNLQSRRAQLLEQTGFASNYTDDAYTCHLCNDSGYLDNKRCECYTKLLKQLAYDEISSRWNEAEFTFKNFSLEYYSEQTFQTTGIVPRRRMEEIFLHCVNYADTFSPSSESLLFIGATGLGKTHLSLAIAKEVIAKGYGVLYTSVQGMVNKLEKERFRKGYDNNEENFDYLEMLEQSDLLILDDLGIEFSTSFSGAIINDILNNRLVKGLPTIISTNL
ncbi:MAG: ATP-binding protein, partial [Oscillospiraceae bacterium]